RAVRIGCAARGKRSRAPTGRDLAVTGGLVRALGNGPGERQTRGALAAGGAGGDRAGDGGDLSGVFRLRVRGNARPVERLPADGGEGSDADRSRLAGARPRRRTAARGPRSDR